MAVDRLDPRADVYSMGATLWELLTFRPLFGDPEENPAPKLMQKIQFEDPEPLHKHVPGIARDLEAIVAKCLEKNPGKRYATARELADDMRRYLEGRPVQARPLGWVGRCWRWCRRRPAVAAFWLSLLVVVLASFAGVTIALARAEKARVILMRSVIGLRLDARRWLKSQEADDVKQGVYAYQILAETLRKVDEAENSTDQKIRVNLLEALGLACAHLLHGRNETRGNLAEALGGLAWAHLLDGHPEEAICAAEEAVEEFAPDRADIWLNLAHGYLFTDQFADAERIYRKYKDANIGVG
jgi:tetratricopeptide (TPR) repeat protein